MRRLDRVLTQGSFTVRPFDPSDRNALVAGRDDEFYRFLGEGPAQPSPLACICSATTIVGWIDYDDERSWLNSDEVNVGYNIFAEHRGQGHATHALRLLCEYLEGQAPPIRPTLLIDPDNAPSIALAARTRFELIGDLDGQLLFKRPVIRS